MKSIEGLTSEDKSSLVQVLELANTRTVTTIRDIRQIDKICSVIEGMGDGETLVLEDADCEFMRQRIAAVTAWVPKDRKAIIALADKVGI